VEFAPDWRVLPAAIFRHRRWALLRRIQRYIHVAPSVYFKHRVFRHDEMVRRMLAKPQVAYKRFRCVNPGWDNSARRARNATIFHNATPERYEKWLHEIVAESVARFDQEERLVFVNAWNEWAEGNHLEPDDRWGRAYLEATARVMRAGGTARRS
jgi:lipopolysaccharide biosynthesis protein